MQQVLSQFGILSTYTISFAIIVMVLVKLEYADIFSGKSTISPAADNTELSHKTMQHFNRNEEGNPDYTQVFVKVPRRYDIRDAEEILLETNANDGLPAKRHFPISGIDEKHGKVMFRLRKGQIAIPLTSAEQYNFTICSKKKNLVKRIYERITDELIENAN